MKILKKIFNSLGYSLTRKHKAENLEALIKLRLSQNHCDYLLDVGSNVGDFTYDYNSFFSKTFAFEPNGELIPNLKNRFFNNKNIFIHQLGVGLNNENLDLYITNDKGKTLSSIKKQNHVINEVLRNTEIVRQDKIRLVNLNNFIKNEKLENKTFFLKTDTQGNDLEVLLGLTHIVFKASSLKNLSNVFLRPFPKPNNTTKIKIPKATVKPERKVLSLFFLIVSNISNQRSLLNIILRLSFCFSCPP